jgi:cytochrome P450
MRLQIHAIVEDLLDAVAPPGQMDIIHDLAYPLPALVITALCRRTIGSPRGANRPRCNAPSLSAPPFGQ